MADRNDRIRELAYLLWLEEGYPEGQAERHWLAAEILVESGSLEETPTDGGDPADESPIVPGVERADAPAPSPASKPRAPRSSSDPKTAADRKN